jgi:acetyltransferase-like isoleucine patch superfamily enzyme
MKRTSMRELIDRYYKKSRGLDTGLDARLSSRDVATSVARRASERLRGAMRRRAGTFIARGVTIRNGSKLTLGNNTSIGSGVSIDALSENGITLGDNVTVDQGAILRGSGVIRHLGVGIDIGDRTAIGAFNVLLGQGGISIGADCLLSPSVTVVSENHIYADPGVPIRAQGEERLPTVIEDDVWIGAGAVILGGSHIGRGAVVAAGAVVRGLVEAGTVVGGVPARVIGRREGGS